MKRVCVTKLVLCISFVAFASIPEDYYNTLPGKSGAALKTALHKIICNDTTGYLLYGPGAGHTWEGFYSTDRNRADNSVIDMYSNEIRYYPNPNPSFASFGQLIQIEHSLPKSWWGGYEWAAYKDLNQLYPSDGSTNNAKSNYPLGQVSGTVYFDNGVSKIGNAVYPAYSGRVFEPADEYKGDFARSYFYMATAYENYSAYWNSPMMNKNKYPVFNQWATDLLLSWHRQDPVSSKESSRTNVVYSFQQNRNPFIDYPELVEYIWGNNVGTVWNLTTTNMNPFLEIFDFKYTTGNPCFTVISETDIAISYSIYTVNGQKIIQDKSFTNTETQFSYLTSGIYLIEINSINSNFKQVFKFIYPEPGSIGCVLIK